VNGTRSLLQKMHVLMFIVNHRRLHSFAKWLSYSSYVFTILLFDQMPTLNMSL